MYSSWMPLEIKRKFKMKTTSWWLCHLIVYVEFEEAELVVYLFIQFMYAQKILPILSTKSHFQPLHWCGNESRNDWKQEIQGWWCLNSSITPKHPRMQNTARTLLGSPPTPWPSPGTASWRWSTLGGPCSAPSIASSQSCWLATASSSARLCISSLGPRSSARAAWTTWATPAWCTRRASWPSGPPNSFSWVPSRATALPAGRWARSPTPYTRAAASTLRQYAL